MLKNKHYRCNKVFLCLFNYSKKKFQLLSKEEHLANMKESNRRSNVESCRLNAIPEANHDIKNTRCRLYSVPMLKNDTNSPLLSEMVSKYTPDLIFVQMDPIPYINRRRFLTNKYNLNNIKDHKLYEGDYLINPSPTSWEEAIVDPMILEISYKNQINFMTEYKAGTNYSSTKSPKDNFEQNERNQYEQSIIDYIICDKWSSYQRINNFLLEGLMGKQKIILGDMPELLLRQIIGNTISIGECRDMFKSVLKHIKESNRELDVRTASHLYYSHIFLSPKDIYMSAMLKNILKACFSVIAFVGTPHFVPMQKYWVPPVEGTNFSAACTIPKRILNERDEDLIEKQAIFEVMLNTRLWSDKYITNPFPYIEPDISQIQEDDLNIFKKTFFINHKKYEAYRDKIIENTKIRKVENNSIEITKLSDIINKI